MVFPSMKGTICLCPALTSILNLLLSLFLPLSFSVSLTYIYFSPMILDWYLLCVCITVTMQTLCIAKPHRSLYIFLFDVHLPGINNCFYSLVNFYTYNKIPPQILLQLSIHSEDIPTLCILSVLLS